MWNISIKIIRVLFLIVASVFGFLLFLSLLSPYISIEKDTIISAIGLFFPALFILNIISLLVSKIIKTKLFWFFMLLAIIATPSLMRVYGFHFLSDDENLGDEITLVSFNMQFSQPIAFLSEDKKEIEKQKFIKELQAYKDIDLLALQEYGWISTSIINSAFQFPYEHRMEDKKVAIFSKYPIVDSGIVDFNSNVANTCLWADIMIDGKTIRLYSFHLESNRSTPVVPAQVISHDTPESKSLNLMLAIVKYYNIYSIKRFGQIKQLIEHSQQSPYPVVLCGDFNDTPQSFNYKCMADIYTDGFTVCGRGNGRTIQSRMPLLRIDYIFTDDHFRVKENKSIFTKYSDHYILKSRIQFQ
jgi:endonuclease/exonuclease/phosphatase family metal-dependent hydrolase